MESLNEDIKRLYEIFNIAEKKSPEFLNGLLIPENLVSEMYQLIYWMCDKAKRSVEYFKRIMEMTNSSQEATHEFIKTWIQSIKDGTIVVKEKEVAEK